MAFKNFRIQNLFFCPVGGGGGNLIFVNFCVCVFWLFLPMHTQKYTWILLQVHVMGRVYRVYNIDSYL